MIQKTVEDEQNKTFCQNVTTCFQEYCSASSIHGVQYFSEKNRSIFERVFWLFFFAISLTACVVVISRTYEIWGENAVGVTISNEKTPLFDIPFPAVTICPTSQISHYKYSDYNKSDMELMFKHKHYAVLLCKDEYEYQFLNGMFSNGISHSSVDNDDFFDFMDKMKPSILMFCSFNQYFTSCTFEEFQLVVTPNGVCYSFNIFNRSTIFADDVQHHSNYHIERNNDTDDEKYQNENDVPIRGAKAQHFPTKDNGLSLKIITKQSDLDKCSDTHTGYDVYIHESSSVPISNSFKLLLNESKTVAVKPVTTTASDSIEKYSINKRRCYFENEKYLKYFKIYTKTNCEMECWTNYTVKTCGCVHFSMPKNKDTQICGYWSYHCLEVAKRLSEGDAMLSQMEDHHTLSTNKKFRRMKRIMSMVYGVNSSLIISYCNCLPTCSSTEYKTEISQHPYKVTMWDTEFPSYNTGAPQHFSTLDVYIDYNEGVFYERKKTYGPVDFLANFGGLLGLFCGFSFLSVIEILYFLTLRIICNVKKQ